MAWAPYVLSREHVLADATEGTPHEPLLHPPLEHICSDVHIVLSACFGLHCLSAVSQ